VCRRGLLLQQVPPGFSLSLCFSLLVSEISFFARADCFRTLFRIAIATKVGAGRRAKVAQAARMQQPPT